MAGIQQAVNSLAVGLASARKVREYGSMQKANQQVQEQRLALQKQKLELAKYKAMTQRKMANAKMRGVRLKEQAKGEKDNQITLGGQKVALNSLSPKLAQAIKEASK